MHIGDPLEPILPLLPVLAREPLNPEVKARLLAEMPFVAEQVGQDLADLGDATPAGSRARTMRLALGAVLGGVGVFVIDRLVHSMTRKKK
jgi:hypothetical protein